MEDQTIDGCLHFS